MTKLAYYLIESLEIIVASSLAVALALTYDNIFAIPIHNKRGGIRIQLFHSHFGLQSGVFNIICSPAYHSIKLQNCIKIVERTMSLPITILG